MHFDDPARPAFPPRGARHAAVRSDASASWELGTRPACTIAFMFLPVARLLALRRPTATLRRRRACRRRADAAGRSLRKLCLAADQSAAVAAIRSDDDVCALARSPTPGRRMEGAATPSQRRHRNRRVGNLTVARARWWPAAPSLCETGCAATDHAACCSSSWLSEKPVQKLVRQLVAGIADERDGPNRDITGT